MDLVQPIGWAAALATFATFTMRTMLPLRALSVSANLLFISYGALSGSWPVLVLHCVLLPLNLYRLYQILRTGRQIRRARPETGLPEGILDCLTPVEVAPDTVIFRRGDPADHIYYLKSGRILLEEIGKEMAPGELFGEVAFFSDQGRRTLTARCVGPCELATMTEADFSRLFHQNPAFGFFILRLLARRIEQNAAQIVA